MLKLFLAMAAIKVGGRGRRDNSERLSLPSLVQIGPVVIEEEIKV